MFSAPFSPTERTRARSHLAFRPLFYWQGEEEKYSRTEYLYPLGKYERTEREVKSYLMPIYSTSRDLTQEGEKRKGIPPGLLGRNGKGRILRGLFPSLRKLEEPV